MMRIIYNSNSASLDNLPGPDTMYYVSLEIFVSSSFSSQLFLISGESAASSRRSSVQPGRASADLDSQITAERESQPPAPAPGHQLEGLTSQGGWPVTNQRAGLSHTDQSESRKLSSQIVHSSSSSRLSPCHIQDTGTTLSRSEGAERKYFVDD